MAGDSKGRVIVWDVESQSRLVTLAQADEGVSALAWSPDGRRIVAGKEDGTLGGWTLPEVP